MPNSTLAPLSFACQRFVFSTCALNLSYGLGKLTNIPGRLAHRRQNQTAHMVHHENQEAASTSQRVRLS